MAYVYKQFTAQDKALIPFNAHKQYDFDNVSALNNSSSYYSSRWTSESYDIYSGTGSRDDVINVIKYNQIDKLYYRNYLSQIHDKLGPIEYIKQPRNLYEKANILSIPMGLYGNQIKPGSFYLKSNTYDIIDDKFGNLLISGTLVNNYPNNIQENVFRLDPIKGFKKYDLGVHEGYTTIAELPGPTATKEMVEQGIGYLPLHYYQKNYEKNRWRRGTRIDYNSPTTFTSGQRKPLKFYPLDKDDSYFMNNIHYYNVAFNTSSLGSNAHKFPKMLFRSNTGSLISSSHDEKFNFNGDEDFSLSFWIRPYPIITVGKGIGFAAVIGSNDKDNILTVGTGNFTAKKITDNKKRYILSKSKTKTVHSHHIKDFANNPLSGLPRKHYSKEVPSEIQFPYEIYMRSSSLYFDMSDGDKTKSISALINSSTTSSINRTSHILCQHSGSTMEIYFDGTKISSTTTSFKNSTRNTADLYIGGNGSSNNLDNNGGVGISAIESGFSIGNYISGSVEGPKYFNGDISNINIWSRAYNSTTVTNISESINGSPYIGNLFYQNGFATITHPTYYPILNSVGIGNMMIEASDNSDSFVVDDSLGVLQFQGTHLIYENEYQCTVGEQEFNDTQNISARKLKSTNSHELADFTTSSLFKPHVTTVGLYDDNMELLVVGKLGQPVRMSDETDTTFVLRWDT